MKVLIVLGALLCAGASFGASVKDGSSFAVFCYYGSWANGRASRGRFGVSDLPVDLCTHIVYSFIGLDSKGALTFAAEETLEGKTNSVAEFVALKKSNSALKLMVAIGGWSEGSKNFSAVVNDDDLRAKLVSNLYNYIDDNGFDGLDLDWEYPSQREGLPSDKEKFVLLVKELKEKFSAKGYLLTAAVAVTQSNIDLSYDVPELNKNLDHLNLMLYDFHGTWEPTTGVNAPLFAQESDDPSLNLNAENSVKVWIKNGATPSKLNFGLGAYGKTFTLKSLDNTSTGAPASGAGQAGPYTGEAGTYAYYEICEDQQANSTLWKVTEVAGNYAYANKDLFWVGYDSPKTIYAKAKFAKQQGLGGIMFWAADLDDFGGLCGPKYPLINQAIAGFKSG